MVFAKFEYIEGVNFTAAHHYVVHERIEQFKIVTGDDKGNCQVL
jgi:hypothetical protein